METVINDFELIAPVLIRLGLWLLLASALAVILERTAYQTHRLHRRWIARRYGAIVAQAVAGDRRALDALALSPRRDRYALAELMIVPLITDRDPERIARTRHAVDAVSLMPLMDRFLRSVWWWRRALALRVLGGLQVRAYLREIIAALDDGGAEVRGAALDALADLHDPASLPAVVARLHDPTLSLGRRAAYLAALGPQCEPLLLRMSEGDYAHRLNYARALRICGTNAARPRLCAWTTDPREDVQAAAFEALGHIGLDERAAPLAIGGLASKHVVVRAMAAYALHDWDGPGGAASRLAEHLDDDWPVAVRAAESLRSIRPEGLRQLQSAAANDRLSGVLARQMLWEIQAT